VQLNVPEKVHKKVAFEPIMVEVKVEGKYKCAGGSWVLKCSTFPTNNIKKIVGLHPIKIPHPCTLKPQKNLWASSK